MHVERVPIAGVTIAAIVLCVECLGLVAYRQWQDAQVDAARLRCDIATAEVIRAAELQRAKLDKLVRDLDALERKLDAAVTAVMSAQNEADRAAAKARLRRLQQELQELKQPGRRELDDRLERPKGDNMRFGEPPPPRPYT